MEEDVAPQRTVSKSFLVSFVAHIVILTGLIMSFDFNSSMPVVKNSDKSEIINATVTDVPPTKRVYPKPTPPQPVKAVQPKPILKVVPKVVPKKIEPMPVKHEAIVIPNKKQKQLQQEKIMDQLLADLKKQKELQKKAKQKALAKS